MNDNESDGLSTSVDDDDASGLELFDAVVGLWLPGILAVFGVIGNAMSLCVLSRDPAATATLTSLKALALSDLVLLVGALCQQIVPMLCDFASAGDTAVCVRRGYLQVYAWPVVCIAQMSSVWLAVLISTERYMAVCAPLTAYRIGRRRLRYSVVVIVAMSIAFNTPRFFEFRPTAVPLAPPPPDKDLVVVTGNPELATMTMIVLGDTWLRYDVVYQYLYNTALYCVVVYAVPLLIVGLFNLRLVATLASARRNWVTLNSSQKRELRATRLPVVIVLVFAICGSVSLLGFILDAVYASMPAAGGRYPRWLQMYTAVSNCLVVFNAAVNFLLMLCFGNKFRRMLSDTVHCRTSPSRSTLAAAVSTTMAAERQRSRSIVAWRETIF